MREVEKMEYLGKVISQEELKEIFELSKPNNNKMITVDIYYYMGFDKGGTLIELLNDYDIGYTAKYCTRKTSIKDVFDFIIYWDLGNTWAVTEVLIKNLTLEQFIQYVKENRNLF